MRNTLFHGARVTIKRTSEYRSAKGWEMSEKRASEGYCGGLRKMQSQRRCIGWRFETRRRGVLCVARGERGTVIGPSSPSSCSPSSPLIPSSLFLSPSSASLWTFDCSHPGCLPSGAQSRATTEIRLAIIVDDKVEQCRTPVSRRTSGAGRGGGERVEDFIPG